MVKKFYSFADTACMAGVDGFEPSEYRSQSPVPYRLAIPQYIQLDTLLLHYHLCDSRKNGSKNGTWTHNT